MISNQNEKVLKTLFNIKLVSEDKNNSSNINSEDIQEKLLENNFNEEKKNQ